MPGLVNCHTHSAMTGLRGIRDDSNLHEWLKDYIWPAEAEFTPDMTTKAVKEALTEMLQSGTTTSTICISQWCGYGAKFIRQ